MALFGTRTAREVLAGRFSRDIGANNPTAEYGTTGEAQPTGAGTRALGSLMGQGTAGPYSASTGNAVVDAGMRALNQPYVWGGNNLTRGVDCSGLVQQSFRAAGINLPRTAAEQARVARAVDAGQAQAGDLVIWEKAGANDRVPGADHIGIYLGGGMVLEASSSQRRVVVRRLWGNYRFGRVGGDR